jgi:hypothetical protein
MFYGNDDWRDDCTIGLALCVAQSHPLSFFCRAHVIASAISERAVEAISRGFHPA